MMTFHKKALLALLIATSLPLMHGCKELGGSDATNDDRQEVSDSETKEADKTFYPIQINSSPVSLIGYPGQSATFSVTASSEANLAYQWFHNGTAITDATDAKLSFIIVGDEDAGSYQVEISNISTQVEAQASLVVNDPPEILQEPNDVSIYYGETAIFSIDASGDDLEYEWQARSLNGWETLDGATSDTLVLQDVDRTVQRQFRVKVKNDGGEKTSRTTNLNLKKLVTIMTQPVDQLVAAGDDAVFEVAATGYGEQFYQWHKAGVAISDGSKYQGSTTKVLTILNVSEADASLYHVKVTNRDNMMAISDSAELALMGPAVITVNPSDTTLYTGQSGALKIAASGDKPISYQWQKLNGTTWQNISGATAAQLSFSSVSTSAAGEYRCSVSNAASSDVSGSATVTVLKSVELTQSPQSKSAKVGDSVSFSIVASGDDLHYEWTKNGQVMPDSASTLSFASVRELDEASYGCRVYNDGGSQSCSGFSLTIQSTITITSQPASQSTYEGGSVSLSVTATGDPTPSVEWYHDNTLVGTGNTLALDFITADQAGEYTCLVKNDVDSVYCDAVTVTVSESVAITDQPSDTSADEGSDLTLTLSASGENLNYQWSKDGSSLAGNSSTLTLADLSADDAGTYSCRVWNDNSSAECSSFTISINGKISITQQPVDLSGYEDDTIELLVEHSGGSDAQVAWYHDGALVRSAGNGLTLSPLDMSDAGDYYCVVSNSVNSVTCNTVSVTVLEKVRITKQPSNQILNPGDDIVLDLVATGELPLTYQCYKGNSLLITSNDVADLVIPAGSASDSGNYYCVVSNEGSTVTTVGADITILAENNAKGSAQLGWNAPKFRADGETLSASEIKGYNVYMSEAENGTYKQVTTTASTSTEITELELGIYYFKLTTVDNTGLESAMSVAIPINVE